MDAPLESLGEFRLLSEVVFPAIRGHAPDANLGDDCAFVEIPSTDQALVITTDAGPRPLAWSLGFECYRTWGWYTVVCNASDLAAAAAEPLAFCSSVEAPDSMPTAQIREFFTGLAEACTEFGLKVAGGNLRSASRFAAHGTALGLVQGRNLLGRQGAKPGDCLVVIGECGRFISTYLKARRDGLQAIDSAEMQVITRPRPQIQSTRKLRNAGLIEAASDNSDGVLGAIWNICERSLCSAEIEMKDENLPPLVSRTAQIEGINPWNIMFFWGDYNVIAVVRPHRIDEFISTASASGMAITVLGRISGGPPALHGITRSGKRKLRILRNENFMRQGYNSGVADHVSYMLREQLFVD